MMDKPSSAPMRALGLLALVLLAPFATAQGAQMLHLFDSRFQPNELVVAPGEEFIVMNFDAVEHTVTSADSAFAEVRPEGWDQSAQPREYPLRAPQTAGTYPFYCRYHGASDGSGMSGILVVDPTLTAPEPESEPAPTTRAASPTPEKRNESPGAGVLVALVLAGAALVARRR